jgi:hypothetical protein
MDSYRGSQIGVIVQCDNGYVVSTSDYGRVRAFAPDGEEIESFRGGGDHFDNFLKAVRSRNRKDLNADILDGHLSSALCHTGNISHRIGEARTASEILSTVSQNGQLADAIERMFAHLKANGVNVEKPVVVAGAALEMDPSTERFTNNESANEMLRRQDRKPFVVPQIA